MGFITGKLHPRPGYRQGSPFRVQQLFSALLLCVFAAVASAQGSGNPFYRDPSPLNIRQIHSGHSLTDDGVFEGRWPGHMSFMINELEPNAAQLGKSTIPGSSMSWRWDHEPRSNVDERSDIANWELMVITERVPFPRDMKFYDSPEWLRRFAEHAWRNGNRGAGAPTLLYTTWTNIDNSDGDWRTLLDTYGPLWEAMADYASETLPARAQIRLIPGHRLMARLYDDIAASRVPGVRNISAFFEDTIHLNGLGSYAVGLLHMAVIHHVDPRGLNYTGYGLSPQPSASLARYIQNTVWEVATSYERAGLGEPAEEEAACPDGSEEPCQPNIAMMVAVLCQQGTIECAN